MIGKEALDREEVQLNFQDEKEVLERFLKTLEEQGVKFNRQELVPEMVTVCRLDRKLLVSFNS